MGMALPLCAQQTWKVQCNGGPGVHFIDLPQAVAAASAGDTILVYHNTACPPNNTYTAPVIDKALRIVGFDTGAIPGSSSPSLCSLRGVVKTCA